MKTTVRNAALCASCSRAARRRSAATGGKRGHRHRDPHRRAQPRHSGLDRPPLRRRHPLRPARGEPVRVARPRAGHRRAEPAELRAGPADLVARLRRTLDLRHPRPAADGRRHPGEHARRPGPGLAHRPRLGRPHRGAARPVRGHVRQRLGRRHQRLHARRLAGRRRRRAARGGLVRHPARLARGRRAARRHGLARERRAFRDRRLSRPQQGAARDGNAKLRFGIGSDNAVTPGRQRLRQPRHPGPARPHQGAGRSGSDPGGLARDHLQHAQERAPEPGRRDARAPARGGDTLAANALRRQARGHPVPRLRRLGHRQRDRASAARAASSTWRAISAAAGCA